MTEQEWIKVIAQDPPGTLYAAADWFEEQGDQGAASFCRWLWQRSQSGICSDNNLHGNKKDYVGPFRFSDGRWQWYVPFSAAYRPANELPLVVVGVRQTPCGVTNDCEEAWQWAFNAWRDAYRAGKLDAELGVSK